MKPQSNPVEDEKQNSGINVKQLMLVGAVTALTGTVVGAVATELYRYFRPKVPIPQPGVPGAETLAANPGMPPFALPGQQHPFAPMQPQYTVQQLNALPSAVANPYATPMALPSAPAQAAMPAPPAPQPASYASQSEPLNRPELAQWQRRLENWQRDLERRESFERDTRH